MTPLQFVTRQRITRAQQLIRETSRSLIDVGLEVGYNSPSRFAHVFRRVVGVTLTQFRSPVRHPIPWRFGSYETGAVCATGRSYCQC